MKLTIKFLRNTSSKILSKEITKNLIPGTQIISFSPSEDLKLILDKI